MLIPRLIACSLATIAPVVAAVPNTNADIWNNGGTFEWDGPKNGNMSQSSFWNPTKSPTDNKAFHLTLSGFKSKASVPGPIELTSQSAIIADNGGSLDFNHKPLYFGHRTALVLDAATCHNLGPLLQTDQNNSSLDIILTNNSMLNSKPTTGNDQSPSWSDLTASHPRRCAVGTGNTKVDTSKISGPATIELIVTVTTAGPLFEANGWEIALEGTNPNEASPPTHITYVVDPAAKQTSIYHNGALVGRSTDVPDFSSKSAVIGNPDQPTHDNNKIHSFAAYDTTLSPQEIAIHAAAAITPASSSNNIGGGAVVITDSTVRLPTLSNAKVTISGYGSLTITESGAPIDGSAINLKDSRTRVHLTNKKPQEVILQELDKFSIDGKLPIYGARPDVKEPGDNILIKSDRADGTLIVPVTQ